MSRTRRRVALLSLAVSLLMAFGSLGPTADATTRSVALPGLAPAWAPAGTVTLTGRGYGHGRGLSQYGARAAAAAGLNHRRILSFYYPGTSVGTSAGIVRVLVSADGDKDTIVRPQQGLRVRDLAAGSAFVLPANGSLMWRLRVLTGGADAGHVQVAYRKADASGRMRWYPYRVLAGASAGFRGSGPLGLVVPGRTLWYRGYLRLTLDRTVNVLSLEDYLRGVVAREMPSRWHIYALRAQAVAARTFAVRQRDQRANQAWQLCDTSACQVYGGYADETDRTNRAIDSTAGEIRTFGGAPAYTQFSASNGGWTLGGSVAYLPAKPDPYDAYPQWRVSVSTAALQRAHPEVGTLLGVRIARRDGNGAYGGRVTAFDLRGSKRNVRLSGNEVRTLLRLKSTMFRFS